MSRLHRYRPLLLLLIALLLVLLYMLSAGGGYPLDDSWIHQVYGRNLGESGQWAFILGIPSAASTSPLYTVLLAIGYALRLPYTLWTAAIGLAALWAAGELAARLSERIMPGRKDIPLIAGLAVILTWQMIWAAASGMETPVFAALTLGVIFCAWRELQPRNFVLPALANRAALGRGVVFGIVGALCTLARPEGVLLVGLAGVGVYLSSPLNPIGFVGARRASPLQSVLSAAGKERILWIIGAAIGIGITIAPYLLLNLSLTGGLLPNTAGAKIAQHMPLLALPYPTRLYQMFLPLLVGGQFLLLPGVIAIVIWIVRTRERRIIMLYLLPLLWVLALVTLYAARLPASYQHGRYVLPALPALVLMGVVGTALIVQQTRKSMIGRVVMRSLLMSAALLFALFAFSIGRETFARDVRIINQEMVAAAYWIRDNLAPDELVAIHDIGAVGYFAPRPMLDVAGLLSPEVVPILNNADALWALMQREGAGYLMAFPDQIPGDNPADPRLCPLYTTGGTASRNAGGANMAVYRLAWDEEC